MSTRTEGGARQDRGVRIDLGVCVVCDLNVPDKQGGRAPCKVVGGFLRPATVANNTKGTKECKTNPQKTNAHLVVGIIIICLVD